MEKMQWFKFSISEWKMGKIQRCKPEAKSAFMELCCLYWINETKLSIEDAIIECDEDNYQNLLSKKVIKEVDGYIKIYFLDEQFENVLDKSEKARESVKKRWLKRNATVLELNNESNTNVLPSNYERNTEEKRTEEEEEKEKNNNKFDFKKSLLSFGFNSDLVSDWLKVRKKKNLTNSEVAYKDFIKQVELNGNDKNYILEQCVIKSWGGFKSEWLSKQNNFNHINNDVLFITPEGIEIKDKLALHVYKQTGKV